MVDTIEQADRNGVQVALVTTTSGDNVAALAQALRPQIDVNSFALVVDSSSVEHPKPAPDAYRYAIESLHEDAGDCVAVEDNVGGAEAAIAAGCAVRGLPGREQRRPLSSRRRLIGSTSSTSTTSRQSPPTTRCTGPVQPRSRKA